MTNQKVKIWPFRFSSLRGARFLAYASEQAPQSRWGQEIATPRDPRFNRGRARNDKRRCVPIFTGATTKMPKIGREIKWSTKY